ncbi:hypothetical protein C8J57DRAFT_1252034 [Mycena rebaudengoi]|nr:hypothetical protein C8J57DRAFT_1252034 [Mycena rebaudengoi]
MPTPVRQHNFNCTEIGLQCIALANADSKQPTAQNELLQVNLRKGTFSIAQHESRQLLYGGYRYYIFFRKLKENNKKEGWTLFTADSVKYGLSSSISLQGIAIMSPEFITSKMVLQRPHWGANDSQSGKFWKSLLELMGGSRKIRGTISIDPSGRLALYWRRYSRNGPKSHLSLLAGCYISEKLAGGHAPKSGSDLVKNPCSTGAFFIFVRARSAMHPINACWQRDKSGKSLLVDVQKNQEGDSSDFSLLV